MRNTHVKEIYKQVTLYLNCLEEKNPMSLAFLRQQNALKYFLHTPYSSTEGYH